MRTSSYLLSCLLQPRDATSGYIAVANEWQKRVWDSRRPERAVPAALPSYHYARFTFRLLDFAAPSLTSPEQLFRLRIAPGQKQLLIPLKEEISERPLFRWCKDTVRNVQVSEEEPLADTTLRPQMTNLGVITGIELPTGPYTFRRGNGQALDNSSK